MAWVTMIMYERLFFKAALIILWKNELGDADTKQAIQLIASNVKFAVGGWAYSYHVTCTAIFIGFVTYLFFTFLDDNKIYSSGYNDCGQTGHIETARVFTLVSVPFSDPVKIISCGSAHTVMLTSANEGLCY